MPRPPHPRDKGPVLGSVPDLGRDFLGTFLAGWRQVGDVCRFRGPRPMCLVAHPDHVQHVMVDRQEIYPRSKPVIRGLAPIMGETGLFVSAGERHRRQRRLMDPLFTHQAVERFGSNVTTQTELMVDRWSAMNGSIIDVQAQMLRLNLEITCSMFFADGPGPTAREIGPSVTTAIDHVVPRIMLPMSPPAMLQPSYWGFRRALRTVDGLVVAAIDERRRILARDGEPGDDLLWDLLTGHDGGDRMTDRQVRDEVMTALFGAFKGIGVALTWTWAMLSLHRDVRERLTAEVLSIRDGRPPTVADLMGKLPYTTMVVEETLRLYPPLWLWSRPPTEDDVIGGYDVPEGIFVLCIPYITHRHPEFWENPEDFDPHRFEPGRAEGRHPYAYFPFGGGPRRCIGEDLSLLTLVLAVATVAQRFRLDAVDAVDPRIGMDFILRREGGVRMRLERVASG